VRRRLHAARLPGEDHPIPAAKERTVMTTPAPQTGPSLARAGDLGTRLLHLIDGLYGPDDLSPAKVEYLTGLPVGRDPRDPHRYGFGAMLDDTWACNLAAIPDRRGGPPKRLVVSVDNIARRDAAPLPAAAPEFAGFADELRACGYAQRSVPGPRGAVYGHRFVRGDVTVDVRTEREDAQAADIRFRVTQLVVDATAPEVGHG
jgi:hypothetical protein